MPSPVLVPSEAGRTGRRAWARRVVAAALVALPAAFASASMGAPGTAGAAAHADRTLHAVGCGPLHGDPPVQAPSYAQAKGASAAPDGWWCQLPHATALPSGFVALRRYVGTLPDTYADYITQYAPKGTTPTKATSGPVITLAAAVSSGVFLPKHLDYPRVSGGRTIRVARGVLGRLTSSKSVVNLQWRFPTAGVPSYLAGVVSVTVTAHDVHKKMVVAFARRVRPD